MPFMAYMLLMAWQIVFHPRFAVEVDELPIAVQQSLFAFAELLAEFGPQLKRPHCDTLSGSRHANMKELRFDADDGVWRVAFAFDPLRQAILLTGGDKSGVKSARFYKALIAKADARYDEHLAAQGATGKGR
jgi:hypothetical protein